MLTKLSLPEVKFQTQVKDSKTFIFDVIRKKYIMLTPEEWVRQHFVHYLIANEYPKSLINVESGLHYNNLQKRSDVIVYDRQGSPFLLIECKASSVMLTQQAVNQALMYNYVLKSKYLAITNGLHHLYYKIDYEKGGSELLKELPPFEMTYDNT
ncbi:type I restriction enzyme HsdR N-terminal domain-containing protein [Thermoflexibacter ruber]|uniref:Type I restriction enzyme R protein N terminus (HSDR_N) n=1 Tax=Thermoflexibacter ruber TaxID=1003 RepID=A0A1I2AXM0_9BACT|nr:type I restriction enzyme HsdR N-terminal domain-containing protein [Thermoflexibacter ruber]SFE48388.1 Type I restriction enzyme R protein N terminus (HSDR_N) [Thermoflexibacter ruber]